MIMPSSAQRINIISNLTYWSRDLFCILQWKRKEPLTFAEIVKRGTLKDPTKTEETKRQECPTTQRDPNAIKTAKRTQLTAENPLAKRCVGEEEQNEGTPVVETPSVEEFDKKEEGERKSAVETCCVEHCCNEEQQKEGTSAVATPSVEESVEEFVRAVRAEGSTAMKTPSVEEFVN